MPRDGEVTIDTEKVRQLLFEKCRLTQADAERGLNLTHSVFLKMINGQQKDGKKVTVLNVQTTNAKRIVELASKLLNNKTVSYDWIAPDNDLVPDNNNKIFRDIFDVTWNFVFCEQKNQLVLNVDNKILVANKYSQPISFLPTVTLENRHSDINESGITYFETIEENNEIRSYNVSEFKGEPHGRNRLATTWTHPEPLIIQPKERKFIRNGFSFIKKRADSEQWVTNYQCKQVNLRINIGQSLQDNFQAHPIGKLTLSSYSSENFLEFSANDVSAASGFFVLWDFDREK